MRKYISLKLIIALSVYCTSPALSRAQIEYKPEIILSDTNLRKPL